MSRPTTPAKATSDKTPAPLSEAAIKKAANTFIRGNDRLTRMLADPKTRAEVDAIVAQMDQADREARKH